MRIVVVTGMSGSGKTGALRALEDLGFYCIDNMPITLLDKLVELFSSSSGEVERLALVLDARMIQGSTSPDETLAAIPVALEKTRQAGHEVDLVYLDASEEILERRYSETRRRHPMSGEGSVRAGIQMEHRLLEPLERVATSRIVTTQMSVHELKAAIQHAFSGRHAPEKGPSITVLSFGFKHGAPSHADLVFDVRFLPNPYFVEGLKRKTGNDEPVARYVLDREDTQTFVTKIEDLLDFLLPRYAEEGKAYLTIAFGCTGGHHRSVALANLFGAWISERGSRVQVRHRDLTR
jgi:UPF0042 nucleotide-binding protein